MGLYTVMPKINVYLPDDLAEAVKDAGVPVSAVCQRALELAVRRVTAVREITSDSRPGDWIGAPTISFTARAVTILESAQADAAADGAPATDSGYLLRAISSDHDSMAVRVLRALDVTPRQIRAELDRRAASGAASPEDTEGGRPLSAELARAVEHAANESSALGTGYVGTEHLLLGLIGEPDGVAGHVLRFLGADLRITRRTVASALAGWDAAYARAAQLQDTASRGADQITAVIQAELAPVLRWIERQESQAAG